ncbi:MAG TPA: sugar phosphate isomerase/epimerase family protein [Verrucomicrobiae bacterium]|jgi:D-psicose/D-tagatose/L-ribulose 3-epimerase|nr:sugar phosphate isomerase/epimerase family protein [Verrucomicrobiae bacterium]
MRLSVNTVLFVFPFKNENANLFRRFKKWGFDAVELLIQDPSHIDPAFIKSELEKQGLVCGSICGAMNPDRDLRGFPASQRNGVKFLCALLDQMVALDCPVLGGPIYSYVGRAEAVAPKDYREQWKTVVRNLRIVAKYAEERGKLVCVEPLNRFETDFLNTLEQGARLIEEVGSPALKLHLDTFHANIEEKSMAKAIRKAGKHLAHLHVCGRDRGTPGNDDTDWRGFAKALGAIRYKGDVVIESVTLDVPDIARSAAVWRRMEPTRDEIAIGGLKFLRKLFKQVR